MRQYTIFLILVGLSLSGCASIASHSHVKQTYDLDSSGRIIAHENGYFNFDPITLCHGANTCPAQLEAIEKYNSKNPKRKQIHFVKLSLRTLNDSSWVVSHNPTQPVRIPLSDIKQFRNTPGVNCLLYQKSTPLLPKRGYRICDVILASISSTTLQQLQSYHFDVYRLDDYVHQDKNKQFSYMLYFKVDPNQNIINSINALGVNHRIVLEVNNNNQSAWIHNYQTSHAYVGGPIYYTGRIRNLNDLDTLKQTAAEKNYKNMWAIEVSGNHLNNISQTRQIVQAVNNTTVLGQKWKSEVDSMHYLPLDELRNSGCQIPLHVLGASMTMTSRPINCLATVNGFVE